MTIDNHSIVFCANEEYGVVKALRELMRIAHGEEDGWAFSMKAKIDSARNLEIYIRRLGLFDGREWSYGDLALAQALVNAYVRGTTPKARESFRHYQIV